MARGPKSGYREATIGEPSITSVDEIPLNTRETAMLKGALKEAVVSRDVSGRSLHMNLRDAGHGNYFTVAQVARTMNRTPSAVRSWLQSEKYKGHDECPKADGGALYGETGTTAYLWSEEQLVRLYRWMGRRGLAREEPKRSRTRKRIRLEKKKEERRMKIKKRQQVIEDLKKSGKIPSKKKRNNKEAK